MLEIRPVCENCGKQLLNDSSEAMICTFECTFCAPCVSNVLHNICPNCSGGFEKRSIRPVMCITKFCVTNYPASTTEKLRPVNMEKFQRVYKAFAGIHPRKR